jgi:hypothetical protein
LPIKHRNFDPVAIHQLTLEVDRIVDIGDRYRNHLRRAEFRRAEQRETGKLSEPKSGVLRQHLAMGGDARPTVLPAKG